MERFAAFRAMREFEQGKINSLVPILERIQSEIKEKNTEKKPLIVYLRNENGEHRSLRYWMSPDGINITFLDTDIPHDNCLYTERGLTPSDFVKKYVPKLDDARKIARNLDVSLG